MHMALDWKLEFNLGALDTIWVGWMDWMDWMNQVSLGDVAWFVANWKGLDFHGRFVYPSAFLQRIYIAFDLLTWDNTPNWRYHNFASPNSGIDSVRVSNLIADILQVKRCETWLFGVDCLISMVAFLLFTSIIYLIIWYQPSWYPQNLYGATMTKESKKISDFCDIRRQVKKKGYLTLHIFTVFTSIWPFCGLMKSISDKFCAGFRPSSSVGNSMRECLLLLFPCEPGNLVKVGFTLHECRTNRTASTKLAYPLASWVVSFTRCAMEMWQAVFSIMCSSRKLMKSKWSLREDTLRRTSCSGSVWIPMTDRSPSNKCSPAFGRVPDLRESCWSAAKARSRGGCRRKGQGAKRASFSATKNRGVYVSRMSDPPTTRLLRQKRKQKRNSRWKPKRSPKPKRKRRCHPESFAIW